MKSIWKPLLIAVVVVSFAIALSYPIRYRMAQHSNEGDMEMLSQLRESALEAGSPAAPGETVSTPDETVSATAQHTNEPATAVPETILPAATPVPAQPSAMPIPMDMMLPAATSQAKPAETASAAPVQTSEAKGEAPAAPTQTAQAWPAATAQPEWKASAVPAETAAADTRPVVPEATATPVENTPAVETRPSEPKATAAPAENVSTAETRPSEPEKGTVPAAVETKPAEPGPTAAPAGEQREGAAAESTPKATRRPIITAAPEPRLTRVPPTATPTPRPTPRPTPVPSPTPDRSIRTGALPYSSLEKQQLDEEKILPELRAIYEMNSDLVGWLTIPDTQVDYPVVQSENDEFYLTHDFFGKENINGQLILDPDCDPHTPSYNLVISGHGMRNGSMFGRLVSYWDKKHWKDHKLVTFDTLMERREYVVMAAFFAVDYDVDPSGFRYNANVQYRMDAEDWLAEIKKNQLYDTGIDAEFGDEFLTLTTCTNIVREDGRFVLICRRIREGETF